MLDKEQKQSLARILIAVAGLAACILLIPKDAEWLRLVSFLVVYAFIGWDILWKAIRRLSRGQLFDENFLMAVATVGAFVLGEFAEGVAVMLFYQTGEWFQDFAVAKSRRSITELMNIRPDFAHRQMPDGSLQTIAPEEIAVGDTIVVKPGERVPLDGVIISGATSLDTSALTGESMPRNVQEGEEILSGCINLSGVLAVRVDKPFGESTVARILELVETASSKKASAENFITKFSRYYTPIVCFAALALAILPPIFMDITFRTSIYRALTFLVISCPCALVISVPLSFFGGIGGASRSGILAKGGSALEALSRVKTVVFDKTGTLTKGSFAVGEISAQGIDSDKLLELTAAAETFSTHPIGTSIRKAYGKDIAPVRLGQADELAGKGVRIVVDGKLMMVGTEVWLKSEGVATMQAPSTGTAVHVAREGEYLGYILVQDEVKEDAQLAISALSKQGVRSTAMFTGDSVAVAEHVAGQLGIDKIYAQLLPAGKVEKLEELLDAKPANESLAFVGDGINDAPVIARADVGIAMGGLGSDAAIEAADLVIMTDEPAKVAVAIKISKKTMRIVWQNIIFALGIKAIVLILGALGFASMWAAVFADVGVSVLAILNAMRALRKTSL